MRVSLQSFHNFSISLYGLLTHQLIYFFLFATFDDIDVSLILFHSAIP